MPSTPDEQLKKLDDEIKQLKSRKQAILNREKQKQKKERTRRLIQCGEVVEKYFGISNIEPTEFEVFLQLFFEVKNIKAHADIIKKSLNL